MHEVQAAYFRRLAAVAESREVGGALAVRTGVPSNTENGVVSATPDVEPRAIRELLEWLAGVPASWVALDPALGPSLVAAGCAPENEAWNMRGELGEPEPPSHEVRPVTSRADLDEWLAIVRECGWFEDVEPARRLHEALGYEGLYLADDGAASAFFAPPTVLLSTVAVRPRRQRRGIGRSLALARLRDARAHGCSNAILSPSPDGRKLYASLGFRLEPQPPGHWFYLPGETPDDAASTIAACASCNPASGTGGRRTPTGGRASRGIGTSPPTRSTTASGSCSSTRSTRRPSSRSWRPSARRRSC